ncbi:MAG: aminoglycoside N(3)-acetyltransferase [Candidatus Hodarchaeota archaeon]
MTYIEHEFEVIKNTPFPNTIDSLKRDLALLGVKEGAIIIMHSSLSKIGWTVGGPVSVIKAMMELLTPKGTLVMPAFTGDNTEPSRWQNPPVPENWWQIIRESMPGFEQKITPTRGMGRIVETFRNFPKVFRSAHPVSSFVAWGKYAKKITKNHELNSDLGENSPLSCIYDLDGQILLLGVSHMSNTSIHLAEYRCDYKGKHFTSNASAIKVKNGRKWVVWNELNHSIDDFEQLGQDFEQLIQYKPKKVGLAESRLLSQRKMVDFAMKWITANRI